MPPSRGRTCCLMRGGGVDGELIILSRCRHKEFSFPSLYAPSAGSERSSGGACVSSSGSWPCRKARGEGVNANAPALWTGASWGCVHTRGEEPSCSFVERPAPTRRMRRQCTSRPAGRVWAPRPGHHVRRSSRRTGNSGPLGPPCKVYRCTRSCAPPNCCCGRDSGNASTTSSRSCRASTWARSEIIRGT